MSETKPSEEQIKAAQEWVDREEAMQLWSASLAQLLATHEARGAEAENARLTLKRREMFNRWGVEIRYDDQEQLALKLEQAEAENARLRELLTAAQVRANELAARVKELEMEAEARDFEEIDKVNQR
jgi:hypothetical protein